MKRYVEYPLEGGGSVIVEVEETASGLVPSATSGELVAKVQERFDDALESIRPVATGALPGNTNGKNNHPFDQHHHRERATCTT